MKGIAKTKKLEDLRREKISKFRIRKKQLLGYINSEETRKKIGKSHKGRKLSQKHKKNISKALKGRKPKNFNIIQKLAWERNKTLKEYERPNWKDDKVGYMALHQWVGKCLGKPRKCDKCGTTKAKRYEWTNISGKYKRNLNDYRRLCTSCHRKEGFAKGEYKTWNKGLKVTCNTGRTWIKKGQHLSPKTEFKIKET